MRQSRSKCVALKTWLKPVQLRSYITVRFSWPGFKTDKLHIYIILCYAITLYNVITFYHHYSYLLSLQLPIVVLAIKKITTCVKTVTSCINIRCDAGGLPSYPGYVSLSWGILQSSRRMAMSGFLISDATCYSRVMCTQFVCYSV